ncbi:MAG: PepSY domain-containing protein, partial [Bacteroidota bacterium]
MAKSRFHKLTKWMLWIHRYTGFVLSLLFLFWFISGFVMMYKDFPYLSRAESLQHKASIPHQGSTVHQKILDEFASDKNWESIKIAGLLGQSVYQFQDGKGDLACFFADTGEKVVIDENEAKKVALHFIENKHSIKDVVYMDELDQWTPRTRFIPYLPAYKVHIDDGQGTVCYVSSVTGEVFQKLNTSDKVWAWLGAIPHWIYFKDLRIHTQLWRDIVVTLSILGTIMCIAGLYIGVIRVKLKKAKLLRFL